MAQARRPTFRRSFSSGMTVREKLFRTQDPIGATIRVGTIPCEVIGLLVSKGQGMGGMDQDDAVIMPLRAVHRRLNGNDE